MAAHQFSDELPMEDRKLIRSSVNIELEKARYRQAIASAVKFDFCPRSAEAVEYFKECVGSLTYEFGHRSEHSNQHSLDRALTNYHVSKIFDALGYNERQSEYQKYLSVGCVPHKEKLEFMVHGVSIHGITDSERFANSLMVLERRIAKNERFMAENKTKISEKEFFKINAQTNLQKRYALCIENAPNKIGGISNYTPMCWSGLQHCTCKHEQAKHIVAVHSVYNINPVDFVQFMECKNINSAYIVMQVFPELLYNCSFSDWCYTVKTFAKDLGPPTHFSVKFNDDVQEEYIHSLDNYRSWLTLVYIQSKKYYYKLTPINKTGAIYTFHIEKMKNTLLVGNTFQRKLQNAKKFGDSMPYVTKEILVRSYQLKDHVLVPDGRWLMRMVKGGTIARWRDSKALQFHKVPRNEWNKLVAFLQGLPESDFSIEKAKSMYRSLGNTIWFGTTKINQKMELSSGSMTAIVTTAMIIAASSRYFDSQVISTAFRRLKYEQSIMDSAFWTWWENFWSSGWISDMKLYWSDRKKKRELKGLHEVGVIEELRYEHQFNHNGKFESSYMLQDYFKFSYEINDNKSSDVEFFNLYLARLKQLTGDKIYGDLISEISSNIELKGTYTKDNITMDSDDMIFVVGPAGCGKTYSILRGANGEKIDLLPNESNACYTDRAKGELVFVAPSAIAASEIEERFPTLVYRSKKLTIEDKLNSTAQKVYTQHTVFQANNKDVSCVVVDECFTYPKGYFIALKCKFPHAQILALGDVNQCILYDELNPYRDDENILNWLGKFKKNIIPHSRSVPKNICKFLNDIGCDIKTESEKEGSLLFSPPATSAEGLKDFDLIMVFSKELKEYYNLMLKEYAEKFVVDPMPVVATIREAQGMRCKRGCFIITQADEKFITSQHRMVYVAFTRTTDSLVVMTKNDNMLRYNINLDHCQVEQNWFVLSNFVPYDVASFEEDPEFLVSMVTEVEKAPLFLDYVEISKHLIKAGKFPGAVDSSQLAVIPTSFIVSATKKGKISKDLFDERQQINFYSGYAYPTAKFCKFFFSNDTAQVAATMTERYADTKNRPKELSAKDIKAATYMFDRFKNRFIDHNKVKGLLEPGGSEVDSHKKYFEQMCIAAAQYLDKVREKGTQHFINPIDFFQKCDTIVDFTLKKIIKQMDGGATSEKEGQGISAWSKNMNCVMCVMHRVFATVMLEILKPNVLLGYESSRDQQGDQFRLSAENSFLEFCDRDYESCSIEQMATDISSFDRTQDVLTQHFERLVLKYAFNVEDDKITPLIDRYFEMRENFVMSYRKHNKREIGKTLLMYITGMKASGEPSTIGMNTLVNMGYFAAITNVENEMFVAFTGDDSIGCATSYKTNPVGVDLVSKVIGSPVKYEKGNIKRFTGYFLVPQYGNVHDWVTTARKLMSQLYRNEEHYNEYMISIRDLLKMADRIDDRVSAKINSLYYDELTAHDVMQIIGWVRHVSVMNWNEFLNSGAEHTTINPQTTIFLDVPRKEHKCMVRFQVSDLEGVVEMIEKLEEQKLWECNKCGGAWNDKICKRSLGKKTGTFCYSCSVIVKNNHKMHICNSCRSKVRDDMTNIGECAFCLSKNKSVNTNLQINVSKLVFTCVNHIEKLYEIHNFATEILDKIDVIVKIMHSIKFNDFDDVVNKCAVDYDNFNESDITTLIKLNEICRTRANNASFNKNVQKEIHQLNAKAIERLDHLLHEYHIKLVNEEMTIVFGQTLEDANIIKEVVTVSECSEVLETDSLSGDSDKSFLLFRKKEAEKLINIEVTKKKFDSITEVFDLQDRRWPRMKFNNNFYSRVPRKTFDCFLDAVNKTLPSDRKLTVEKFYFYVNEYREKNNEPPTNTVEMLEGMYALQQLKIRFALFAKIENVVSLMGCWIANPRAETKFDCIILLQAENVHFVSVHRTYFDPAQYVPIINDFTFKQDFTGDIGTNRGLHKWLNENEPVKNLNRWKQTNKPEARTDIKIDTLIEHYTTEADTRLVILGAAMDESFKIPMFTSRVRKRFNDVICIDPRFPNDQVSEPQEGMNLEIKKTTLLDWIPVSSDVIVSDIYAAESVNNHIHQLIDKLIAMNFTSRGPNDSVKIFFKVTCANLDLNQLHDRFAKYFGVFDLIANPGSVNSSEIWFYANGFNPLLDINRDLIRPWIAAMEHRNLCAGCKIPAIGETLVIYKDGAVTVRTHCLGNSDKNETNKVIPALLGISSEDDKTKDTSDQSSQ